MRGAMKILFVLPDNYHKGHILLGAAYLSAVLKTHGHTVELLDYSVTAYSQNALDEKIRQFAPALLAISVLSTHSLRQALEIAGWAKAAKNIPVIAGGVAVMTDPETFIGCEDIDMICIGEGEEAMLELVSKISSGEEPAGVKNLWIKKGPHVIKNDIRPPIEDLDSLPFPDWSLFPSDDLEGWIHLMASRGCVYDCKYCVNGTLRRLYGLGRMRQRSPENVIAEILEIKKQFPKAGLWFYDDIFPFEKSWTERFSGLYLRQGVNMPFSINMRIELCNEPLLKILRKAGLEEIRMGIESGDERIRKIQLGRDMSNARIKEAFALARRQGLRIKTYGIIGVPGEGKREVFKTIALNLEVNADVTQYGIFQPYPGTALYDECVQKGYLIKTVDHYKNYRSGCVISTPKLTADESKRLWDFAMAVTAQKKNLIPLLKITGKLFFLLLAAMWKWPKLMKCLK